MKQTEIKLNMAEINSDYDRVRQAEGLIIQLPITHNGRNTWLLNYGIKEEATRMRAAMKLKFMLETESCELAGGLSYNVHTHEIK